jgi:hypothetical protein
MTVRVRDAKRGKAARPFASHVVTSPPYLNAQDYYRNFKLELGVLDSLVPFDVCRVRNSMIGTERGTKDAQVIEGASPELVQLLTGWAAFVRQHRREAWIVARYFRDMDQAMRAIDSCLEPGGTFVLVCGDNLVGGLHIPTSRVLTQFLTDRLGYLKMSASRDRIRRRYVAPRRMGHRSIIKTEIISVFRKPVRPGERKSGAAAADSERAA